MIFQKRVSSNKVAITFEFLNGKIICESLAFYIHQKTNVKRIPEILFNDVCLRIQTHDCKFTFWLSQLKLSFLYIIYVRNMSLQ